MHTNFIEFTGITVTRFGPDWSFIRDYNKCITWLLSTLVWSLACWRSAGNSPVWICIQWTALRTVHYISSTTSHQLAASNYRYVDCVWNVMAHAQKPDFVFQRNGRVHLKKPGALVQSTTGSRGVHISGSNARYTMFRGSVRSTGYSLHSPVNPSLPPPCVTVCHHISTGCFTFYTILYIFYFSF